MIFANPAWLLLLPALALLAWQWPRLGLRRPLRAFCVLFLALALADPMWRLLQNGMDLWVLVDRSDSAADLLGPRLQEWEGLLRKSMAQGDQLHFLDFGEDAGVRPDEPGSVTEVSTKGTRIANAIQLGVVSHNASRDTRFLLLTDGYSTEPLDGVTQLLTRSAVSMDVRFVTLESGVDFQVDSISAPNQVQAGEPFVLDARLTVDGAATAVVPYQLERDGQVVAKGQANFQNGEARIRASDRLSQAGSARYTVRIFPQNDPIPGNNQATTWVEAVAGPRVLVISAYPDDPAAAALQAQGISVELETNPSALDEGRLSGARAVIFNNVPANLIPMPFLQAAEFFVRDQGQGLLMLGGKNSFGSGGYYGSKLGDILPVSMELREEQRKLAVAMAIVLDRSGSMGMTASGGHVKMDLADAGAAEAVRLLGPSDLVAIVPTDTQPHVVVPLINVKGNLDDILDRVQGIKSQGGGIVVPQGLKGGWGELKNSPVGQKHIILFADANDALQQHEGYEPILKEITDGGATVSVIGMGTDHDSGADYLREIARLGNGPIFFCADPNDLPAVFTQDTVAVSRSTFSKDPVAVHPTAGWAELAARPLDWLSKVDGYNVTYLQPNAASAAFTNDDLKAPLVAFWQRGSGRAAAVTFPLAGAYSDLSRAWPAYGDFVTTLTHWLMGADVPPGLGVKARLDGDELVVDLLYDQTWEPELTQHFPEAVFTQNGYDARQSLTWERLQPGHFQARARLAPGKPAIGVIKIGEHTLPFGPLAPGEDLEWRRDPAGPRALRAISAATGGEELTELPDAWRDSGRRHYRSLRPPLLVLLALLVIAEAACTRFGVVHRWPWEKKPAA